MSEGSLPACDENEGQATAHALWFLFLAHFTVFQSSSKRPCAPLIECIQQVSPPDASQHVDQALILSSPTAGSFALVGARPSTEASAVKRLRDAGAVILGKTNGTEWSNSRSPHTPNGWSALYGQCYGAFFGSQDPEGSSSGCAVAMSVGLAAAAVGVEVSGDT